MAEENKKNTFPRESVLELPMAGLEPAPGYPE